MESTDLANHSPLRALDKALGGGLERGDLGVVIARHGTGKTTFLVCIALDNIFRGKRVLHISLDTKVDHVREFYEQIFAGQIRAAKLEDNPYLHLEMERARRIHAYHGTTFSLDKLRGAIEFMHQHASFTPDVILVDTWDFATCSAEELSTMKSIASASGAELWMTANRHRDDPIDDPDGIPTPVADFKHEASVIIFLQTEGASVSARVLKPKMNSDGELPFVLDPTTMLLKNV